MSKKFVFKCWGLLKLVLFVSILSNCAHHRSEFSPSLPAPQHPKIPHAMTLHGDTRIDNYFWMKKRDSQEVLAALELENKYYESATKKAAPQREKLFQEMKARVKEDDSTVPYFEAGYWYYTRYEVGQDYPIYGRKKESLTKPEEILLDVNQLAKGKKYTHVAGVQVADNNQLLAYAVDHVGRRNYDIYFLNLQTGELLQQVIRNASSNFVWSADSQYLFFTQKNPQTLRSEKVVRYYLAKGKAEIIFSEGDELFNVGLSRSKTKKFLFIYSGSFNSTEVRFVRSDQPKGKLQVFHRREKDHQYQIEDAGDGFFVLTNWNAENFRLMKSPYVTGGKKQWRELISHRPDTYLSYFDVFKSHLVLSERFKGLTQIRIAGRGSNDQIEMAKTQVVGFPDPAYMVYLVDTPEYNSSYFRYNYQSMVRPATVYEYSFTSKNSTIKKVQPVPTYNSEQYHSERVWSKAQDGTLVPISIVYKKALFKGNGTNPLLVYGYGSYGYSMDAVFRSDLVSLLDRGFVYAIIHVRGGSEMGRYWYEQGRMMKKKNTFTDFIDGTDFLIANNYGDPYKVFASGGSAGGLLMGAIMNLRPELYRGLIFEVPFVDVLTTMLDPEIPLTAPEYEQWGNPNDKAAYEYIKSYSPYDQLRPANYPPVYVRTGYHDSQVQYWEPAKFVAKLRDVSTSGHPVLFQVDMDSGHSGASGRFQSLKDESHGFSFLLQLAGIRD